MSKLTWSNTALIVVSAFLMIACNGRAMAASDGAIEEIIVTAEKRDANLQDVPIAVSVFSGNTMDDMGIIGVEDLANYTPGMTYSTNPNRITIRGVGRLTNELGSEPGIAIYRDGVYTSEATGASDNPFFLATTEVLRGPQGTLYGRNAIGGAANVVSKKPTYEPVREIRASVGEYGASQLGFSSSGPMSDRVRYRVALFQENREGWIDNQGAGDLMGLDRLTMEGQLEVDLTERLDIWLKYMNRQWNDEGMPAGPGLVLISPYNTVSPAHTGLVPNPQLGYDRANPGVRDPYTANVDERGDYTLDNAHAVTAHVNYDTPRWAFKYIFGYQKYDWGSFSDADYTSRTDIQYLERIGQDEDYYSHEIQGISNLEGNMQFIFGLYYLHDENVQPYTLYSPTLAPLQTPLDGITFATVVDNPQGIYYYQNGELDSDSYAAYGQMDYYPSEAWHVSLGLRYSKDEKTGLEENFLVYYDPAVFALALSLMGEEKATRRLEDDWNQLTWSVGLDYAFTQNSMGYLKISTGYKAGGFKLGLIAPGDPVVDEETVLAYELGYKATAGKALRFNSAVYYYDYSDMQVPVSVFTQGIVATIFLNASQTSSYGFEAELEWAATSRFSLFGTYSYMNTKIDDMGMQVQDDTAANPTPVDVTGNELVKSPHNKITLNGRYVWPLAKGNEVSFVATYNYLDEQEANIFNTPQIRISSWNRVDLRLSYEMAQPDLRISAYLRNATDEDIFDNLSRNEASLNNQMFGSLQAPRTWGLEFQFDF